MERSETWQSPTARSDLMGLVSGPYVAVQKHARMPPRSSDRHLGYHVRAPILPLPECGRTGKLLRDDATVLTLRKGYSVRNIDTAGLMQCMTGFQAILCQCKLAIS